jgi:hypothetical protein
MPKVEESEASCTVGNSPVSTSDAVGNNPSNANNLEDTNRNQKITMGKEFENLREMLTDFVQMMFVSGETAEPSTETTTLIEDITRQQVLEIVNTKNLTFDALFTNNYIAFSQHRFGNSPRSALHLYR